MNGVLSCLEHAGEPVHGSVGVRATDALDEGTDDVVVAVAAVADRLGVDGSLGIVERDMDRTPSGCGQGDGDLGAGERMTAVAARPAGEMLDSVGVGARPLDLEPPSDEFGDVGLVEGMETKQGRSRHQWRIDLEVRFSVVAPISTISPSSTAGSSVSCWALLNRCTSSRNRIVPVPRSPSR